MLINHYNLQLDQQSHMIEDWSDQPQDLVKHDPSYLSFQFSSTITNFRVVFCNRKSSSKL